MNRYFAALLWRIKKYLQIKLLKEKIRDGKIKNLKLHFGCGSNPLTQFTNVDFQFSKKIDLSEDLNNPRIFPDNCAKEIFSNAFFEHLFRENRVNHLKKCNSMLDDDGILCYIGLPYFPEIAKLYLQEKINFNLFNVYRFTHGNPESSGKANSSHWMAQLHKSLFDENEIKDLLNIAGFKKFVIFKYCHPGEESYPVNIGFYAIKSKSLKNINDSCINYLKEFDKKKIIIETLEFIV